MERIMDELSQCPSICLDDIEIAIKIMIDEEGDELGCHYFANTRTQEVFYLDEVEEGFFYPQYGMKILSRDHLSKYHFASLVDSLLTQLVQKEPPSRCTGEYLSARFENYN